MSDDKGADSLRDEIAFIKNALEEGRNYARMRSADFAVWGAAIAAGYFGTYAHVTHLWSVDPRLIWYVPVGLAWAFSLRGAIPALIWRAPRAPHAAFADGAYTEVRLARLWLDRDDAGRPRLQ